MKLDNYGLLSEFNELCDSKVHEYFTEKLDEIKTQLIYCQEESTYRTLQGKCQMLSEIINSITTAKDSLIELRRTKPTMSQAF